MQKFGVIGYPLTHSLSPQIHNHTFQILKIDAVYEKIEISPESFNESFNELKSGGYSGFNITIPYKLKIMSLLDEIDSDARTIGAVNTIVRKENKWVGYNTDVSGFLNPLLEFENLLLNCLVLGTGGAARAVIFALARYLQPQSITIAGRNLEKAANLSIEFGSLFEMIHLDHHSLNGAESILSEFNLIVNTTPIGTFPNIEQTPLLPIMNLTEQTIVYDLVYNPLETKLLKNARRAGKNIFLINGMEMLLQQAASAFKLWTNEEMPIANVRDYILNLESLGHSKQPPSPLF
jgi:shikimate dehydrogenase